MIGHVLDTYVYSQRKTVLLDNTYVSTSHNSQYDLFRTLVTPDRYWLCSGTKYLLEIMYNMIINLSRVAHPWTPRSSTTKSVGCQVLNVQENSIAYSFLLHQSDGIL
jgi:hypothetical protein